MTKTCSKCKEVKNVGEFNKNSRSRSGLNSQCKECRKEARMRGSIQKKGKSYYIVFRAGDKQKWLYVGKKKQFADKMLLRFNKRVRGVRLRGNAWWINYRDYRGVQKNESTRGMTLKGAIYIREQRKKSEKIKKQRIMKNNCANVHEMERLARGGIRARGSYHYKEHLKGNKITRGQAIIAKCYECANFYSDGRLSCEIVSCPLYPFMPYKYRERKQVNRDLINSDNYCATLITRGTNLKTKEIPKEIIKLKKVQLLLKREIRKFQQGG